MVLLVRVFNSFNIYRTPPVQAMRRPCFEPPDIDVVGIFDDQYWQDFLEDIEKTIPDPTLRAEYLDTLGEYFALQSYIEWVFDAGRAALGLGNVVKVKFYETLINTLREDFAALRNEHCVIAAKVLEDTVPLETFDGDLTTPFRFEDVDKFTSFMSMPSWTAEP